eukprot:329275-Chlamydomonas_euryale.AAC.1
MSLFSDSIENVTGMPSRSSSCGTAQRVESRKRDATRTPSHLLARPVHQPPDIDALVPHLKLKTPGASPQAQNLKLELRTWF